MIQLVFPGLESSFGFDNTSEVILNPERAIDYFENKGYIFLSDWNSGNFLTGKEKDEPYIPDRICLPSGRIFDERELLTKLDNTEIGTPERQELEEAFYYYNALLHESMNTRRHDRAFSFFDLVDEKRTLEKYRKQPFFS